MSALRPVLLSFCALTLALILTGCATISMAATSGPEIEGLHGPAGGPEPVTPPLSLPSSPNLWKTTVKNLSGEDLAGPCEYDMYLANPSAAVRGVLVIFDRGDSSQLFVDGQMQALAGALNLGMVLPLQCNAASFPDIQSNALVGPGRALFTALDQFATLSSHPELAKSDVVLFGFSAAGVLAATMTNYKPTRVIGTIVYCGAGSYFKQLNDVVPAQGALGIPFLVLSNDRDTSAGTERDQLFFEAGWQKGAPWSWGVQHGVSHCCAVTTAPLIMPWISAVTALRLNDSGELSTVPMSMGVFDNDTCTLNGIHDGFGYELCSFTAASLIPAGSSIANAQGWLPDAATGSAWLKWVGF